MLLVGCLAPPAIAQLPTQTAESSPRETTPNLGRSSSAAPNPSSYILGAGDQIEIKVFEYDEYTGAHVILPDGAIVLPLIGRVSAGDRTVEQLTQDLTIRLKTLLVNPIVTIGLTKLRPVRVNVAGEVRRPGSIQLQSLIPSATTTSSSSSSTLDTSGTTSSSSTTANPTQAPTISSALLAAGGVTQDADIRQVTLKRQQPSGESTTLTINLWDGLTSVQSSQDLVLRDGDSLFIPKVAAGTAAQRRLTARSTFAPMTVRVRVVGEVKKPGEVEVPPDSSLSSAVAIAGGPTDKAKLRDVVFIRMNEDGRLEQKKVDLSKLTDDYQVQEGDVVMVPISPGDRLIDRASQIISPLGFMLRIFGL